MGAAARKIAHSAAPARPPLRVVRGGRPHARARSAAGASGAFRVVAIFLVVMALAGVARVALAARAAEASMNAWSLRAEVKAEELACRTLEADRSALAAPSRIEAVASETLNMGRPAQVSYLQLPSASPATSGDARSPSTDEATGALAHGNTKDLFATVMDLAAGEAQVMLVGDVGLGSLR